MKENELSLAGAFFMGVLITIVVAGFFYVLNAPKPEPIEMTVIPAPIEVVELPEPEPIVEYEPPYLFPIHLDDFIWDGEGGELTSAFGERDPSTIGGLGDDFHDGLDLWGVSHVGTWHARIVAVADGVIKEHWLGHPVYGKMIVITHDDGSESVYAHLSESFIHERRPDGTRWRVEQGDVIGRQGSTGLSKGRLRYQEHLHFELRVLDDDGELILVNPLLYVRVPIPEEEEDDEEQDPQRDEESRVQ